jgi:hypothetical protein
MLTGKRARAEINYVLCGRKKVNVVERTKCPFSLEVGFKTPTDRIAELGYRNMIFARQCDMKK